MLDKIKDNLPAILAFIVMCGVAWFSACKTLGVIFGSLAVLLRGLGLSAASDRVQWLSQLFSKAATNAHDGLVHLGLLKDPSDDSEPKLPKPPAVPLMSFAMAAIVSFCLATGGCSWFGAHEAQVAKDAAVIGICVLEHETAAVEAGKPLDVTQTAIDCGQIAEQDVIDILAAHKKLSGAEQAHPAPAAPKPCGSNSCLIGK